MQVPAILFSNLIVVTTLVSPSKKTPILAPDLYQLKSCLPS